MQQQPPPPNPYQQPQYPPVPPVQQKPKRKLPRWVWIIIALFVLGGLVNAVKSITTGSAATDATPVTAVTSTPSQSLTPTPIPSPTPTPKPLVWTTTHTFTGNGNKKTETFTVASEWKLQWKCDPTSNLIGEYNVIIDVKNTDTTDLDPGAINTLCKAGNTSGETEEHQGGGVYLDVTSEDTWTITVQELK